MMQEDRIIGKTTPVAFGYRIGRPGLLAMVDHACCVDGQSVSDYIAGVRFNGQVKCGPAYDPKGRRMLNAV